MIKSLDSQSKNPYEIKYLTPQKAYYNSKPKIEGVPYTDLNCLKTLGLQGSSLFQIYSLLKEAISEKYNIILGFTTNAISCGLRQIIAELCKLRLIHCIVTTGGAIEEDLIKTYCPFRLLEDSYCDKQLYSKGINRTGNILCPNEGYIWFEDRLKSLGLKDPSIYNTDVVTFTQKLCEGISDQKSFLYWSLKNNILVLPLCISDGCIGDHFAIKTYNCLVDKSRKPSLDVSSLLPTYLNFLYKSTSKICVVALGGGAQKHFIMNGLIPYGGANTTIYLNNHDQTEGSNAGAPPEEAISWGKIKTECKIMKYKGDYVLPFYLVASQLIKEHKEKI